MLNGLRFAVIYTKVDCSVSGALAPHCRECDTASALSLISVTAMGKQGNCTIKYEISESRTLYKLQTYSLYFCCGKANKCC